MKREMSIKCITEVWGGRGTSAHVEVVGYHSIYDIWNKIKFDEGLKSRLAPVREAYKLYVETGDKSMYNEIKGTSAISIILNKLKMVRGAAKNDIQIEYYDLVGFDIDNIKGDILQVYEELKGDPHIILMYISSSGTGIKGIIQFEQLPIKPINTADYHKNGPYKIMEKYLNEKYLYKWGTSVDTACKNINREMYINHCDIVYFNENYVKMKIMDADIAYKTENTEELDTLESNGNITTMSDEVWQKLKIMVKDPMPTIAGTFYPWFVKIAGMANVFGIPYNDLIKYITNNENMSLLPKEWPNYIKSIYSSYPDQFGSKKLLVSKTFNCINNISELSSELIKYPNMIIESPPGAGKSYYAINSFPSIVLIVPTIALAEDIVKTYGIKRINTQTELQPNNKYVVVYDSISKILNPSIKDFYWFLDEYQNLISALSYREDAIKKVKDILSTVYWWQGLSGTPQAFSPEEIIKVNVKNALKRKYVHVWTNSYEKILPNYIKGKTLILLNNREECKRISSIIPNSTYISSKHRSIPDFKKYDVVIGTECIAEGISITQKVDSIISINIKNPMLIKQFIHRPRTSNPTLYNLIEHKRPNIDSFSFSYRWAQKCVDEEIKEILSKEDMDSKIDPNNKINKILKDKNKNDYTWVKEHLKWTLEDVSREKNAWNKYLDFYNFRPIGLIKHLQTVYNIETSEIINEYNQGEIKIDLDDLNSVYTLIDEVMCGNRNILVNDKLLNKNHIAALKRTYYELCETEGDCGRDELALILKGANTLNVLNKREKYNQIIKNLDPTNPVFEYILSIFNNDYFIKDEVIKNIQKYTVNISERKIMKLLNAFCIKTIRRKKVIDNKQQNVYILKNNLKIIPTKNILLSEVSNIYNLDLFDETDAF